MELVCPNGLLNQLSEDVPETAGGPITVAKPCSNRSHHVANVEARRETDWLVHYLTTVAHHLECVSASAAKSAAETGRGGKAGRRLRSVPGCGG